MPRRIRRSGSASPNGPKAKLANEKPKGETIAYDELVKRWTELTHEVHPRASRLRARDGAARALAPLAMCGPDGHVCGTRRDP